MSRLLILIRHAKAIEHRADDHARELAPRGRADAAGVGAWMVRSGTYPELVVVSTATRTRQTWEQISATVAWEARGLSAPVEVLEDRVYDAELADLLEVLAGTAAEVNTLAIVGHNPGIEQLAHHLDDGSAEDALRDRMASGFRTGAVAVLELPTWTTPGRLVDFSVLRDRDRAGTAPRIER